MNADSGSNLTLSLNVAQNVSECTRCDMPAGAAYLGEHSYAFDVPNTVHVFWEPDQFQQLERVRQGIAYPMLGISIKQQKDISFASTQMWTVSNPY